MYTIISYFVNLYTADIFNRFLMLFALWLLWPGLLFVLGFLGESRRIPLFGNESKAYIPGSFAFGILAVTPIRLHVGMNPDHWGYSIYWWESVAAIMFVFFVLSRIPDSESSYTKRAMISPTKVVYDIICHWLFPTWYVGILLPALTSSPAFGPDQPVMPVIFWIILTMAAAALFTACEFMDRDRDYRGEFKLTSEAIRARHIDDWRPIWKKK